MPGGLAAAEGAHQEGRAPGLEPRVGRRAQGRRPGRALGPEGARQGGGSIRPDPAPGGSVRLAGGRAGLGAWSRRPEGASSGRGGTWPPPRAPVRQGASGGAGRVERGRRRRRRAPASSSSRTRAAAAGRTGTAPATSARSAPRALFRHVGGGSVRRLLRSRRAHGHLFGRRGAPRAAGPRGRGPRRRPGCARATPRGRPARAPGAANAALPGCPRLGPWSCRRAPPAGCQYPGRPARRVHCGPGGRLARLLLLGRFVSVLRPRPRRRACRRQEPPLSLPGLRQSVL